MTESFVNCPNCQEKVSSSSAECPYCQVEFFSCSSCNGIVLIDDTICPNCNESIIDEIIVPRNSEKYHNQKKIRIYKIESIVKGDFITPKFPSKCVYCCKNAENHIYETLKASFPIHKKELSYSKAVKLKEKLTKKHKIGFDIHLSKKPTDTDTWQICIRPELNLVIPYCSKHFRFVKNSIRSNVADKTTGETDFWDFLTMLPDPDGCLPVADGCGCTLEAINIIPLFMLIAILYYIVNYESFDLYIIFALVIGAITWGASQKIKRNWISVPKNFPRGMSYYSNQLLGFKAALKLERKLPLRIKAIFEFINKEYSELFLNANEGFYSTDDSSTDLLSNKNRSHKK